MNSDTPPVTTTYIFFVKYYNSLNFGRVNDIKTIHCTAKTQTLAAKY